MIPPVKCWTQGPITAQLFGAGPRGAASLAGALQPAWGMCRSASSFRHWALSHSTVTASVLRL